MYLCHLQGGMSEITFVVKSITQTHHRVRRVTIFLKQESITKMDQPAISRLSLNTTFCKIVPAITHHTDAACIMWKKKKKKSGFDNLFSSSAYSFATFEFFYNANALFINSAKFGTLSAWLELFHDTRYATWHEILNSSWWQLKD